MSNSIWFTKRIGLSPSSVFEMSEPRQIEFFSQSVVFVCLFLCLFFFWPCFILKICIRIPSKYFQRLQVCTTLPALFAGQGKFPCIRVSACAVNLLSSDIRIICSWIIMKRTCAAEWCKVSVTIFSPFVIILNYIIAIREGCLTLLTLKEQICQDLCWNLRSAIVIINRARGLYWGIFS